MPRPPALLLLLLLRSHATKAWSMRAVTAQHASSSSICHTRFQPQHTLRCTPPQLTLSSATPWLVRPVEQPETEHPDVMIRTATAADVFGISELCTDGFFGTHSFPDGPVIFLQRLRIWARVMYQIGRRIAIDEGRECRLLVAVDGSSGTVHACVDVAVHLFDQSKQRFELTVDEMPSFRGKGVVWRPYVASLAVRAADRKQGLGRLMMQEAERTASAWGYREMMLEVAACNEAAAAFYTRLGYRRVRDAESTGAQVVRTRDWLDGPIQYWEVTSVAKRLMRKPLPPHTK
jgi:ribosomal protein S18 acetylase RimI-like enzyme